MVAGRETRSFLSGYMFVGSRPNSKKSLLLITSQSTAEGRGTNIGQVLCGKAAIVAGIEYSVAPGLVLGFECHPGSYRYDIIQMAPRGFDVYTASHQSIRVFEMPVLKLGIRF